MVLKQRKEKGMKFKILSGSQLREAYRDGQNIAALLREQSGGQNSAEIIETAYDLSQRDPKRCAFRETYAAELEKVFAEIGMPSSVLEAGVGEATTLSYVLKAIGKSMPAMGVDISWSRVNWARRWLGEQGIEGVKLALADLEHLPLSDNAIDVVYTSHSIEPNRGREREILAELYRVTGRYLVLLEPAYELAGEKARARMDEHGYCRDLPGQAEALGMRVVVHRLFPLSANPENPTALTVIEKATDHKPDNLDWHCPVAGGLLVERQGFWYSDQSMLAYPVLGGLPCLRCEKGIIASQYLDDGL
jgi:hypothetical protein